MNLLISASESGEKPPWSESGSGDSFAFLEQIKGNCRRASQSKQVRQGLKRVSTNHTTTTTMAHHIVIVCLFPVVVSILSLSK